MKASVKFIIGSAATIVLAFLAACIFASGICAAHTDGYVLCGIVTAVIAVAGMFIGIATIARKIRDLKENDNS